MLRLRILSLVFAAASLAAPTQATLLVAAGGLQGAAVFANSHVDTGMNMGLGAMVGTVAPLKPLPRAKPADTDGDSQLYAMIALGVIGLTLIRRKRYGRN